jgi:Domain of unknown function (DUF397)
MEGKELTWRKATRSASTGDCVEVGSAPDGRARGIRDSKRPNDGHLLITPVMLGALLADIRNGNYDLRLDAHTNDRLTCIG